MNGAQQAAVYAAVARAVYVPSLSPDFAFVFMRDDYELEALDAAYQAAHEATAGFRNVSADDVAETIRQAPPTLRVFRLILGFTTQEFAAASDVPALAPFSALVEL